MWVLWSLLKTYASFRDFGLWFGLDLDLVLSIKESRLVLFNFITLSIYQLHYQFSSRSEFEGGQAPVHNLGDDVSDLLASPAQPVPHSLAWNADLQERLGVELKGGQPAPLPPIIQLFVINHVRGGATRRISLSEKSF